MHKYKSTKITEQTRSLLLRRPLAPGVVKDTDILGLALHVTRTRGLWCLHFSPHGVNPVTNKRWGSTRLDLGDAMAMPVWQARAAALTAKALIREGRDPHREKLAQRANLTAQRGVLPVTVSESLDAYEKALMTRQRPSLWSRRQNIRNARSASAYMNANSLPLAGVTAAMVRLMLETVRCSDAQRQHLYGSFNRFMSWCRKQGLVEHNPCADLDRSDRPKPGRARDHVPTLATLRAVYAAAEAEPAHVHHLLKFMLLTPLRRTEASALRWSEINFAEGRLRIAAQRMKAGQAHELPLSPPVRAILEARKIVATGDLVFPTNHGKVTRNWDTVLKRIRRKIGESEKGKDDRFSLHDIRRGFVGHLAGAFDVDALDQCLAHVRGGVAGVYQHSSRWPDRVRALDRWAEMITGAEPGSNVVKLVHGSRA